MSGCDHRKRAGHLKWCQPCALDKAGPKPEPKFQVGEYAIGDRCDDPGTITKVQVHIVGEATDDPKWAESVHIQSGGDWWCGPAACVVRLVPQR